MIAVDNHYPDLDLKCTNPALEKVHFVRAKIYCFMVLKDGFEFPATLSRDFRKPHKQRLSRAQVRQTFFADYAGRPFNVETTAAVIN